jgi:hypothetical protein
VEPDAEAASFDEVPNQSIGEGVVARDARGRRIGSGVDGGGVDGGSVRAAGEPAGSAAGPAGRTAPGVGCVVGGVDAADAGAAGGVDPGPGKPKGGVPEAAEPEGPGTVEADGRMGPAAGAAWSSGSGKGVSEVVRAVPSGRHVVHAVKPSSRASS